ncbi:hypothetical protein COCNU_04G008360 [Cocos nucifera]|uniref:Uncharacterized protein n=1 Tax=Cocos nucifera TaxID=13894 RepID=A0A8K0I5U7_COCNU|nr:hypothetical protein COCNU_04G008360 [Cocos nucifera]
MANIEMINIERAEASKAAEEVQGYKVEVSHLLAKVGRLQEVLQREERTSANLRVVLTLKEKRREEVEINSTEEKKRAREEAISFFKSSEELREIKMAFAQEAFIKRFASQELRRDF